MASFDYNYYETGVYSSGSTAFGAFSPSATSGNVSDGEPDGTFETGDTASVTTSDLGGAGDGQVFVGTLVFDGVTFAIFGPTATLTDGVQYHMYAYSDTPINTGAPSPTQGDVSQGTSFTVCFAPGTLVATPDGETAVENLRIGDMIATAEGKKVAVKWIGRQTVHKVFSGERACPVRIAAGALGGGLPHTDLVLTADHALIFGGLAINAGALVNGTTITLDPLATLPERVTYYHVETEAHDVILANGVPTETFVDYVGRQAFDNHAEYVELYGDERIIAEMPLPRISTARLVPPALKARIAGAEAA